MGLKDETRFGTKEFERTYCIRQWRVLQMNPSHRTHCVPSSILCALIYVIKEKRPVRIAISKIDEHTDHAQAQVFDENGEWQWLSERWNGECMEAFILGHQNHPDAEEPYRYVRVMEFMQEQIQVLGLENLV